MNECNDDWQVCGMKGKGGPGAYGPLAIAGLLGATESNTIMKHE